MTWLFPLYLLGGVAIIGPILMHLRRRPPQDRVEFSSLMFLEAQTPMPVSKRKLEHWLLLLLRCLALLILALMFSRPLWRVDEEAPATQQTATVVLLDRSASMQRGTLWAEAMKAATQRVEKAAVTDRLALAVFDRETKVLWSFDQDRTSAGTRVVAVKAELAALKAGWSATDLGQALVEAAGWFSSAQGMAGLQKRVVLITDLQEGAKLEALRSLVWPENVLVELVRIEAPNQDNFTLSLAASAPEEPDKAGAEVKKQEAMTRVRISNARESKLTDFSLDSTPVMSGHLAPGASRVMALPLAAEAQGTQIMLSGDAWDFDNRIYIAPAQPKTVKIVFIGDEKTRAEAASPLFYLSRALQVTTSLKPELVVVPESAPTLPADVDIVFVSGAKLSAALLPGLRALAEKGGLIVSVVTEGATTKDIEALTGLAGVQVSAAQTGSGEDYQMLADVQTAHPLLTPFADERLRDFTKLRFWKHRRVTLPGQPAAGMEVLARFDGGDPAILVRPLGKGRVVLLASGWHPADSQLALSTKFVPLLYGWLEAAGFRNEQAASLLVGDVLPGDNMSSITLPDGQRLTPKAGEAVRAPMPGLHKLTRKAAGGQESSEIVAVNLPPEEGRITPMDAAKLRELGVRVEDSGPQALAAVRTEEKERLAITEQEARQRAWIWLLGGLLAILAWETWLAGRIRQGNPPPAFTSA